MNVVTLQCIALTCVVQTDIIFVQIDFLFLRSRVFLFWPCEVAESMVICFPDHPVLAHTLLTLAADA